MTTGCNVGAVDRAVRIVLGVGLLGVGLLALQAGWAVLAYLVAAVALVTGAVQICPLYALLGISTCREPGISR
ncbi:MAG: YgaP family membrane protein [Gemmatimonadota bacterium]